jgi:hypothetical protein
MLLLPAEDDSSPMFPAALDELCMVLTKLLDQCEILFFFQSLLIKKDVDLKKTLFCASYTQNTKNIMNLTC